MWGRDHGVKSRVARKGLCARGTRQESWQVKPAAVGAWPLGPSRGPLTCAPSLPHPSGYSWKIAGAGRGGEGVLRAPALSGVSTGHSSGNVRV